MPTKAGRIFGLAGSGGQVRLRLGLRVLMCPEQVCHHSGHPPPPGLSHLGRPLQHLGVIKGPRGPLPLPTSLRKSLWTLPQTQTQQLLSRIPRRRRRHLNQRQPPVISNNSDKALYTKNNNYSHLCVHPIFQTVTRIHVHSRKTLCSLKYKTVRLTACQESTSMAHRWTVVDR